MAKTVKIYTMNSCPYCEAAKALLKKRNITYEEITLSQNDDAAWDALYKLSGMKTVPQIFLNDKLIGGFQDLSAKDRADQLQTFKND